MKHCLVLTMCAGLVACGKGDRDSEVTPVTKAAAASAAPTEPPKPAAVTSKLEASRCTDPCLFLTDTPIAQVADAFKAKCGAQAGEPPDLESCDTVDYTRNCVFAAHGVVYKKRRWKQTFAAKPWYEPHADVTAKAAALGEVERANVHELYMRGKACKQHLEISGADYDKIKQWFAALPDAPLPKIVGHADGGEGQVPPDSFTVESGKDFLAWFNRQQPNAGDSVRSGKGVSAATLVPEELATEKGMLDALHGSDPSKLRAIGVGFERSSHDAEEGVDSVEGTTLTFVYDDGGHLLAIFGEHYATEN